MSSFHDVFAIWNDKVPLTIPLIVMQPSGFGNDLDPFGSALHYSCQRCLFVPFRAPFWFSFSLVRRTLDELGLFRRYAGL